MRTLVIEDDADLASNIAEYLEAKGFELDFAYDGVSGLHLAATGSYDVIVLDVMLPRIDGFSLCRRLHAEAATRAPILMLTARDALADKIEGFEAGADDYLVKPFALPELHHRLLALARRGRSADRGTLRVHDLCLDTRSMSARRGDRDLRLNRTDLKILALLMRASPGLVTRAELEAELWGDRPVGDDLLRSYVYRLRRAIDRPFGVPLIHTVHGQGYLMKAPDA